MDEPAAIVVPCFNEAHRLDLLGFSKLASDPRLRLIFVDDGSTDATRDVLLAFADEHQGTQVVHMVENAGKGETVRQGMTHALAEGATTVGYLDADLATPPRELLRLSQVLDDRQSVDVLLGSRVALMGREIHRHPARHWIGRIFATAASIELGLRVYDTQCGAKLFRSTPAFRAAIGEPFGVRWTFDVILLARMLYPGPGVTPLVADRILEEPLLEWRDVTGSKVSPSADVVFEALRMSAAVLRLRRRAANEGHRAI